MNKIIILFLMCKMCNAQYILNGDFETNTAATCLFNMTNFQYTGAMNNSWGFGSYTELDIQTFSCGYAVPPSNSWFVSLAKGPMGLCDALSLEINTNLITGNTYQISYFEYSTNAFGNQNIPLEIGLSNDSLNFGDLIHTSLPSVNTWTHPTFTFIAPNNGKYLTVRTDSATTMYGWNFVDDFQILSPKGIEDNRIQNSITINPNPFSNEINVTIKRNDVVEVILYDVMAKKIFSESFENSTSINTQQLAKGVYIYEVRNMDKVIKKGKVVKN